MMMMPFGRFHWAALIRSWPGPRSCSNGPSSNSQWLSSALLSAQCTVYTVQLWCKVNCGKCTMHITLQTMFSTLHCQTLLHIRGLHYLCNLFHCMQKCKQQPYKTQMYINFSIFVLTYLCLAMCAFVRFHHIWWIALSWDRYLYLYLCICGTTDEKYSYSISSSHGPRVLHTLHTAKISPVLRKSHPIQSFYHILP